MVFDSDRTKLLSELTDLIEEEEACNNQYRSTTDDAERIRLKRKLVNFKEKINEKNSQLGTQDSAKKAEPNRRSRALEQKLSKIDFKEQISVIKNILEEFVECGNAVFFVNDSLCMAGDLFCIELKKILQEETTDLKHYEIAFTVSGSLDEIGFLQGLAGYLGMSEIKAIEEYSIIIEKILSFIENGSIIFIELKKLIY